MEELLKQIKKAAESMLRDATAQEKKGNKAAGLRARKASLALEPMLKEFRKMSIAKMKGLACLMVIVSLAEQPVFPARMWILLTLRKPTFRLRALSAVT